MTTNIAQLFTPHRRFPDRVLYRHFIEGAWRDVTVSEIAREVARWQAAFRREGLASGDRVAICVRNGVTWVAMDLAALGMSLVVVPLYVDDNAESVAWCVGHAEARLLIVDNSRIAASLAGVTGVSRPLPPVVIVRPDEGETGIPADTFLPEAGGEIDVAELPPDTLATI